MRYDFTPTQLPWRDEIRAFCAEHVAAAVLDELCEAGNEGQGPQCRGFVLKLRDRQGAVICGISHTICVNSVGVLW